MVMRKYSLNSNAVGNCKIKHHKITKTFSQAYSSLYTGRSFVILLKIRLNNIQDYIFLSHYGIICLVFCSKLFSEIIFPNISFSCTVRVWMVWSWCFCICFYQLTLNLSLINSDLSFSAKNDHKQHSKMFL